MSHDLIVERWFDAAPEEVFDAYTDPDAQREWYQESWMLEIFTTSPELGEWTNRPPPM